MKRRYMYTIPRQHLFKMPKNLRLNISRIGDLWIDLVLNEEEVFLLWTQGIKATPVYPG